MYLYKRKFAYRHLILPVLIFTLVLLLFYTGFCLASSSNKTQNLKAVRSAVQKSISNCYAAEGVYPPDVKYLESHYGLLIDHTRYIVDYGFVGSNVMPSVAVFEMD